MNKILCIIALLLLNISLLSCSTANQEPVFQVTPSELFTGDSLKFKSFIENAGAVKVQYRGEKESIRLLAEVWVNGELKEIHPQMGGFLTKETKDGLRAWNGEAIISIDKSENDEGYSQYTTKSVFYEESGQVSYGYTFNADEVHTAFGDIPLHQEQSVSPEEGEVAIWGLQATNLKTLHTMDFSPEQLKLTDWAVIFKLAATEADALDGEQ
ncbi:hypothetical protein [Paenibacillus sp. YIM B09110]|uniref:hypothetical protein n=1 Tax=Paenibacillus sp. YIM B09110 TaxID=3126102 RepID=UPI00301C91DE